MMLGSKAPNYDTCGLLRTSYSHDYEKHAMRVSQVIAVVAKVSCKHGLWLVTRVNPTKYSHIVVLMPHFYAHILAGLKGIHPHLSKLMWVQTF